jgi:hypothetical protein
MTCDTQVLKALIAMEKLLEGMTKTLCMAAPLTAGDNELRDKLDGVDRAMRPIRQAVKTEEEG